MIRTVRFLGLLLLATGLLSLTTTLSDPEAAEREVLKLTNDFRKSRSKKPFVLNDSLSLIARRHSEAMASGRVPFGHKDFKAREKEARKMLKSPYASIAENVAYGTTSVAEIVEGWKNSPGHRQNMLGNFRLIGIGVAEDKDGQKYYTQLFVE